ncbi:MAG TPA: hypothetical protein VET27_20600 [Mycobacterium sp.]|nr:hypothetical protein [Mycobacterium sp.]
MIDEPFAPPRPKGPSPAVQWVVVAVLAVVVAAYVLAVFLTRDHWAGSGERAGTATTFTAQAPDGSPPTPDQLTQTQSVLSRRMAGLGIAGAVVSL